MNDEHARRFQSGNPYHALIGVELVERGDGRARCRLPVTEKVRGGVAGSVHGSVISALVDIVTLAAISSMAVAGEQMAGTAELNVSYLRPALGDAIFATARVLKKDSVRLQPTVALVALATGWRGSHERRIPGRQPVSYAAGSGR